jgi:hypothetical protein
MYTETRAYSFSPQHSIESTTIASALHESYGLAITTFDTVPHILYTVPRSQYEPVPITRKLGQHPSTRQPHISRTQTSRDSTAPRRHRGCSTGTLLRPCSSRIPASFKRSPDLPAFRSPALRRASRAPQSGSAAHGPHRRVFVRFLGLACLYLLFIGMALFSQEFSHGSQKAAWFAGEAMGVWMTIGGLSSVKLDKSSYWRGAVAGFLYPYATMVCLAMYQRGH